MRGLIDFLFVRRWWAYDPTGDAYAPVYHWINLVEGTAWVVFAALVLVRYLRHGRSPIELLYALTFLVFGLTDFREAYVVQTWLIVFKVVNLVALIWLRHLVIKRFYPESRTY